MKRSEVIETVCLVVITCIFSFLLGGLVLGNIMFKETNKVSKEWDEASIIIEGEEIICGQIDYHYTTNKNEMMLFFSDGNMWTASPNNVVIQHHKK